MVRNLTQLAKYVGVCTNTIKSILKDNKLEPTEMNGSVYLFNDEISSHIKQIHDQKVLEQENEILSLVGQQFDRLYVKEFIGIGETHANTYLCECSCGNETYATYTELINGKKRSCGCLQNEIRRRGNIKHGDCGTRLYRIYKGMKSRCYNPKFPGYKTYGGRGIRVCDEWLNDYKCFREWSLSNNYSDNLSIDRIDNDGNYCPSNCRWATRFVQQNNTSKNKFLTIDGETKTVSEWCRFYNINLHTYHGRIRMGWDPKRAFITPSRGRIDKYDITYNGKTQSISAWAKELGMNKSTLTQRLNARMWSIERALTEPIHNNGRKNEYA